MDATLQGAIGDLLGTYLETITDNIVWILGLASGLLLVRYGIGWSIGMFKKVAFG